MPWVRNGQLSHLTNRHKGWHHKHHQPRQRHSSNPQEEMSGPDGRQHRQKSQHNTHAHNAHQAREILQSQAQLQELQAKAQAEALAQAQALPAPQSHPVAQCATPESGDVNAFLKDALMTVLQGNEELRKIFGQHESVAKEAATRIDEIVTERNSYFTNARDLTKHFREMQQKYKGPNEINLASLAALKERLANKSGGHISAQQTNTARGEKLPNSQT